MWTLLIFLSSALAVSVVDCDIVVAGGSVAALAASLAAADQNSTLKVCLLEPTDWPGGQLTSSLITAVDFGPSNHNASTLPFQFYKLLQGLGFPTNPGSCWVSYLCYTVTDANELIAQALSSRPNLSVFLLTTVLSTQVAPSGAIISVTGVTRSHAAWDVPYSAQVEDWYDPQPSARFNKTVQQFASKRSLIVIDATELGDVLVTSNASFVQGTDSEYTSEVNDTCGQCIVFPFYLQSTAHTSESAQDNTLGYSLDNYTWEQVWTYRRASERKQISLQAWGGMAGDGNDYPFSYHLQSRANSKAQLQTGWRGGVNMSTLREAEYYSLNYSAWYCAQGKAQLVPLAGTKSGLSKVPYVRDTRRALGLGGFRLTSAMLSQAEKFSDRVGIGHYNAFDFHAMQGCTLPTWAGPLRPYYLPFRALTCEGRVNLLVAGKTMAQTTSANSATRLHPVEWASGAAAGASAAYMLSTGINDTAQVLEACSGPNYCPLQELIAALHAPIEWPQ